MTTGRASSPLPQAALDAARRPFGESSLLPLEAYVDDDVFDWELRHVFERAWVCVGRASELSVPGAQRAEQVGRSSVMLVRDRDGELRAFANICRHRGHELLACGESTVRGVVQCPYHAWSYELDGSLRAAPHAGPQVVAVDNALVPLRVAEWGGWVFVDLGANGDVDAISFTAHAGALVEIADAWHSADLVVAEEHRYEVAGNWKLVCENYHECYHCPLIHPELCRVTDAGSGANVRDAPGAFVGGTMALSPHAATMSTSGRLVGTVRSGLDELQRRQIVYLQLFPNLLIAFHPDYVLTHRLVPLTPGRTRIECQWLFAPIDVARPDFDPREAVELWDVTNRQDWAAVESMQRGMLSPHYRPGVLAHNEDAVHQFVAMVACAHLGVELQRGAVPAGYLR